MMLKVDFKSIRNVGENPKGLFVTWVTNWLIKPFTMFGIASLFFYVIFQAFIPADLAKDYLAGAVLLGAAPCTAMVVILDNPLHIVLIAVPLVIQTFLVFFIAYLTSKAPTLILVTRPENAPLKEAERASYELADLDVRNQSMIINGVLTDYDDTISEALSRKQQNALTEMPESLQSLPTYMIPLWAYNITGIENVRGFLTKDNYAISDAAIKKEDPLHLKDVIDDLAHRGKKVIFTMGKGGVGKTTIAAAIALGLSEKGKKVHLATTDPAAH